MIDPRVTALRQRLNEALFEVNHGEYFRARVHGWMAYAHDIDVELPVGVADRLSTRFEFARSEDAEDIATVDAFVIAYHAAETFWRYLFAVLDGSGPVRAPLLSMAGLKAGKTFNDRLTRYLELSSDDVHELLNFAFLPRRFRRRGKESRLSRMCVSTSCSGGGLWPSTPPSGAMPTTLRSTVSR